MLFQSGAEILNFEDEMNDEVDYAAGKRRQNRIELEFPQREEGDRKQRDADVVYRFAHANRHQKNRKPRARNQRDDCRTQAREHAF